LIEFYHDKIKLFGENYRGAEPDLNKKDKKNEI
jgi:hypothetical protein